ncbi:hypothetical protein Ciccas_013874 [Cichlidogyrus casuarinus]|uniref:Uncharacterized protein n=1 Tax=Cichlidogyrus casuarinus TaxID=1844966 RepID=A0ABD2PK08_9PLAT
MNWEPKLDDLFATVAQCHTLIGSSKKCLMLSGMNIYCEVYVNHIQKIKDLEFYLDQNCMIRISDIHSLINGDKDFDIIDISIAFVEKTFIT